MPKVDRHPHALLLNLDDNVPFSPRLKCPLMDGLGRRPDGENGDEPERIAASGSAGASEKQRVEGSGCGEPGGGELPTSEAVVEAVSRRRGPRAEAWQCRTSQRASQ